MPLIAAVQLFRITRFFDLSQQAFAVTCIDALCECHIQHADAWIVVVIVLVMMVVMMMMMMVMMMMMMMMIIIIMTVTIIIIECAVSSVT